MRRRGLRHPRKNRPGYAGPCKTPRGAARRRKEKTVFKKNKKLAFWQDKLRKARAAYADELNNDGHAHGLL